MPVECHISCTRLLFLTILGCILPHSLSSWAFHALSFPTALVQQSPKLFLPQMKWKKPSPFALLPPCWCLPSTLPPQSSLVPLLPEAHLSRWLPSPFLELCPSYQAAAVDKEDDWSWAEDPQCRRGDNMGLLFWHERKRRVVLEGPDSCSLHIFRAELLHLQCILRQTHQEWKQPIFILGVVRQLLPDRTFCDSHLVEPHSSLSQFPGPQKTQRGLCQCGSSFPSLHFPLWYLPMVHFSPFNFPLSFLFLVSTCLCDREMRRLLLNAFPLFTLGFIFKSWAQEYLPFCPSPTSFQEFLQKKCHMLSAPAF